MTRKRIVHVPILMLIVLPFVLLDVAKERLIHFAAEMGVGRP